MIRQILGAVSEYERSMIALRLRSGRRRKAAQGRYIGGSVCYGKSVEAREYTPDQREQAALARMRELQAGGASLRSIAVTLKAEGITAKRGGDWHPQTIARVLARTP